MKRLLLVAALAAFSVASMTGCAAVAVMGAGGSLYADAKAPMPDVAYYGPEADGPDKMGEASFSSILGLVQTGDASIQAAMRAGGITKLHHVDYKFTNILGIIATYTTIAYGE